MIPTCNEKYLSDLEYIFFAREKGVHIYGEYETKSKLYESPTNKSDKKKFLHFTIKPLRLIENLIINSSKEEEIVFDPFIGSGTTAVACKNLGRNFIGFEINQEWVNIANDRLNNTQANGQISLFTE